MPRIAALLLVLFATGARAQEDAFTVLPYIPRAGQAHEAFIQIRNPQETPWSFTIDLFDLDGTHVATAVVYVPPRSVQWVNSRDLEHGTDDNDDKDVVVHVDRHEPGQGSVLWGRVKPPLPPRVSLHAYLRSRTGFVTEMSQGSGIVGPIEGIPGEFQVLPFFNPASNRVQRSSLRIVNTSPNRRRTLTIVGVDDAFGIGRVICTVPPLGVLTLSAPALEGGSAGCDGAFGDGTGKWTVHVSQDDLDEPIVVMSLLHNTATGDITNLSAPITEQFLSAESVPNTYAVLPYIPRAGQAHEAFIQIRNPEYTSNALTIELFDFRGTPVATAVAYVPPRSVQWVNSRDLEYGTDDNDDKDVVVHVDRHVPGRGSVLWGRIKPPLPPQMLSEPPPVSLHVYLRTRTGFVTEMSQGSGLVGDPEAAQVLPLVNPASNYVQRSSLRIVNTSPNHHQTQTLTIVGVDDAFGIGRVICTIPPLGVLTLSASALEGGPAGCDGAFGDGSGRWAVFVLPPDSPVEPVFVMSLLHNAATGDITNLSAPITEQFQGDGSPAGRLNVEVVEGARGCSPLAGCVTVRNEGSHRSRPAALAWWTGEHVGTGVYLERRSPTTYGLPALEPGETRALAAAPPARGTAFATDFWVCVVDLRDDRPRSCSRKFRDIRF